MATGFFLFGLIFPNFNAMAMEPHGDIAGTASSFLGFFQTGLGAALGWVVGQTYDGTGLPLSIAFTVLGLSTLALVRIGDRNPPGPVAPVAAGHAWPPDA
jgi:DHA1 family bicyclomycin/chloramphenicol resistance-like MFS transporter